MQTVSKFDHKVAGLVNTNVENTDISLKPSKINLLNPISNEIIILLGNNILFIRPSFDGRIMVWLCPYVRPYVRPSVRPSVRT